MFSVKDSVPQGLRSRVVYKFSCAGCNASYIGKNARHLRTRAREHLLSDKSSHVYRHLQSAMACRDSCNTECFTILDSAASKFQIKMKEALHIKWDNPILNQQLRHQICLFLFNYVVSFVFYFIGMRAILFFAQFVFHIQIVHQF